MKGNLPESNLVGGKMISMPTPTGHSILYPAKLAMMGMQGTYVLFQTMDDSGQAYLCTTQPDRVRIRAGGPPLDIAIIYEGVKWPETNHVDENGFFFYKTAPSLEELNKFADNLSSN